ncbi:MAG: YjbQ family protein [candidate division WOR-3 bacterium]|nr:MAG: YjbQ family protein [candidate division WOR-3 bacterium]
MIQKITVSTKKRQQMVDITAAIQKVIGQSGVDDGIIHVYCPHTTAAVTVNENCDDSVQRDITETLARLIPHDAEYSHSEGNSDAHIKAALMGSSRSLFIEGGKLGFGSWQGIFLCEFDGPRTREIWVKIYAER